MQRATEYVTCEVIDSTLLLQGSTGEHVDSQAASFGVAPEQLLFDPGPVELEALSLDERAADVWAALRVEACEH